MTLFGVAAVVVLMELMLSVSWTAPALVVVAAWILLPAIAALAFTSALTITPLPMAVVIEAPLVRSLLTVPVTSPLSVKLRALLSAVAVVALPLRAAVIVPALKLPLASRATMVDAVLALVAVVALLATLPAVLIVASLLSAMAAPEAMSALTMVPYSTTVPEASGKVIVRSAVGSTTVSVVS